MATLRQIIHCRDGLLGAGFQLCPGRDTHVNIQSDSSTAVDVLYHCFCWSRNYEKSNIMEVEWIVHGTQPVFDDNKCNSSSSVYRAAIANVVEEWDFLCDL